MRDILLCNACAVNLVYVLVVFWWQGHFYHADWWEPESAAHAVSMGLFYLMTGAALANVAAICGVQVLETAGKLPRRPLHHHTVAVGLALTSWVYCLLNTVPWFLRQGDRLEHYVNGYMFFQAAYGFITDLVVPMVFGAAFLTATAIMTKKTRSPSAPSPVVQWKGNRPRKLIETQLSADLKMPPQNGSVQVAPEDGNLLFFPDQHSDPLIAEDDRGSEPYKGSASMMTHPAAHVLI